MSHVVSCFERYAPMLWFREKVLFVIADSTRLDCVYVNQ